MKKQLKSRRNILETGSLAAISVLWLIIRTGEKPSRIAYPCQRAALANIHVFLLTLFGPLLDFRKSKPTLPDILNNRLSITVLLMSSLLLASRPITSTTHHLPHGTNYPSVPLNLKPQTALNMLGSSNLFLIENASGLQGNMDAAMSTLLLLMQNYSLFFFKTARQSDGLIGKDDVVIIKVNAVGPERSGTNTDLIKSLISKILNHPEGFAGEIVVADNGQSTGGLDLAENNAFDHSQSMQDIVNMFVSYKVSTWSWYTVRSRVVNEYIDGDLNSGYVVNSTENPTTHLRVSYPKFQTKYGTYVSLKKGIWSTIANSYTPERLKIINVPVLKSHRHYGVTACMKNYMGVVSQTLTNAHDQIRYGAMGTEMAETRFPTLTILDAIWVNANPKESSSDCGPQTPYEVASFTNVIGASRDPVALEYWACKHILIPAAIHKGYVAYSSLNPDYTAVTPGLTESYHNYLERSMDELKKAGYQATMNESEMNVHLAQPGYLFEDGFESGTFNAWSGTGLTSGETAFTTSMSSHHGTYSAVFSSNGDGGSEKAFCYKGITSSTEFYVRGYFRVAHSGISDDNDRFHLIALKAKNNAVAYAGWTRTGAALRWCLLTRDGISWAAAYSAHSPSLNQWYCVELRWVESVPMGRAELFVNGVRVCVISGKNTAAFGDASHVHFGLPLTVNCSTTKVYVDCSVFSVAYIGPEAIFKDSFESGSFSSWTGASVSSGETTTVVHTLACHGTRSAKFMSNGSGGSEWAYCYKTIPSSRNVYARSYLRVESSGAKDDGDRFYFIRLKAGSISVAHAGWRKTAGVTRWCLMIRDATSWMVAYSTGTPSLSRWYSVELHWIRSATRGKGELWVDGKLVCTITGKNTEYSGDATRVEFGLPNIINCGATTIYCDYCAISNMRI